MEFGRCLDPATLEALKLTLPAPDSIEEKAQLERLSRASQRSSAVPRIYVGAPIWNHAAWIGNFYPESASPNQLLEEYAKQFNAVEVNSTFYAIPPVATFQKWQKSVGSEFRFCPKFPKSISHSLDASHADLKVFTERVLELKENLGVCFLQLPEYFSMKELSRLENFVKALPRELRVVVELRSSSFFSGQRLKPEVLEMLAKNHSALVSVDTPLEREVAHVSLSATRAMVRFLGSNLHVSDEVRLKEWAKRIAIWFQAGIKELYFMVHEPDNTVAPEAADLFIQAINEELKLIGKSESLPRVHWNQLL